MKTRHLLLSLPVILSVTACANMNTEARYPSGADRSATNGDIYEKPAGIFGKQGLKALLNDDDDQEQADEIAHLKQAKVSLMDAMKTAEKETKGQAVEGILDDDMKVVHYKIDILKDDKLLDVIGDGNTGKVLKVYADKED